MEERAMVVPISCHLHTLSFNVATRNPKQQPASPPVPANRRRWFFVITLAFPFFLLLLFELILRIIHYGPDLSLFTEDIVAGKKMYVQNQQVKGRYFSRFAFSPSSSPDYFLITKPPDTYRIFCLGGSTTVGYPYWYNGAFSTFLRDRLNKIFPDKHVEIINVGMTATNSFTVLDMAQDIIDYKPDLLIVYDGHNEFYGALGVASHESFARARWLTLTYLKLVHCRTFLLLRDLYQNIAGMFHDASTPDMGGTMMEKLARGQYVTYGSTVYHDGLEVFRANLDDLKTLCERGNIPIMLSSQVSNLRGQPPFVSDEQDNRTPEQKLRFNSLFNEGLTHRMNGHVDSALASFRSALMIDSLYADAHYQIARCLDSLGLTDDAGSEYIKARDYDRLRFRTSTDFNNTIHNECNQQNVIFVDMEKAFQEDSPQKIIGNELIVEHLHPNSRGYFLMAKEYARVMREHRLFATSSEWASNDTINDDVLWQERNLTDIDEIIARRRTEILTSGWPFQSQTPTVDPVAADDTLGHIAEEVTRAQWTWEQAHMEAADYYLGRGETNNTIREYQTLTNMIPVNIDIHLKLAKLYLDQKQYEATRRVLLKSLEVDKTILAYRALGDIYLNMNQPGEAAGFYEKTFTFEQTPPERVDNGYLLALAYARANMLDKSATQLLQVLSIKPDYQPAVKLLSEIKSAPPKP